MCIRDSHRLVQDGHWRTEEPAAYGLLPQVELLGKTFGIYGYGSIGRQTARLAKAFGMEVLVCTRTVRPEYEADGVESVSYTHLGSGQRAPECPGGGKASDGRGDRRRRAQSRRGGLMF